MYSSSRDAQWEAAHAASAAAREVRHAVLHDAVRGVIFWALLAFQLAGLSWILAHYTVSLQLTFHVSGSCWALLGSIPLCCAERLLQRTAAGMKMHGLAGDGCLGFFGPCAAPVLLLLPPLP
ncbi:unnamed protein product, partial [Polarella glacialis]